MIAGLFKAPGPPRAHTQNCRPLRWARQCRLANFGGIGFRQPRVRVLGMPVSNPGPRRWTAAAATRPRLLPNGLFEQVKKVSPRGDGPTGACGRARPSKNAIQRAAEEIATE